MKTSKKTLTVIMGGAFAASIAATSIHAAENPFAIKSLGSGYMVADADSAAPADKPMDGKCSTGKCSASKKKATAGKMKEGSCHADKAAAAGPDKAHEGSCSAGKMKEGSCHADK